MLDRCRGKKFLVLTAVLLAVCLTCSSCETLRKKFTRQKKKGQESTELNPVLEPQEYPAPEYNAAANYREHYDLIKAWYKDLYDSVTAKGDNDPQAKYALKQIHSHLDGMASLLVKEKKHLVDEARALLKEYGNALKTNRATRNRGRLQVDLRDFDRKLRHDLRLDAVKKDLVTLERPH